jgi:hypothetical protein
MKRYITHPQELSDLLSELKEIKTPYYVVVVKDRPRDGDDYQKWKRLNSFFHRGIVPVYGALVGLIETEAKKQLQSMFALVEDHPEHYLVESISGMNTQRLINFIEQCQTHLVKEFGSQANELIEASRNELLTTKKIKK